MSLSLYTVVGVLLGVAAGSAAFSPPVLAIDCEGCVASAGIRHYTWRNNGANPPVNIWDQVGGTIQYTIDPKIEDHGKCKPDGDTCVPDPTDTCQAKQSITITNGGTVNRYSHNASGCQTFAGLTAADKTVMAESTTCNGNEEQDIFFGYMSATCAGPAINDEKIVVFAECSQCKVKTAPPE